MRLACFLLLCLFGTLGVGGCGSGTPLRHRNHDFPPVTTNVSVKLLPCGETIATNPPAAGTRLVLGVVALPTSTQIRRALQTASMRSPNPADRLFAKSGLVIRSRTRFELVVPKHLRDQLAIGWGNGGEGHAGSVISVPGCPAAPREKWLDYAGGFWARRTMCAPLIVVAHHRRVRVRIGVGKACPGQLPPLQPSST